MNIFSNIGITELIVILLLALLVVGPERLPEMGRQLAKILRDVRKMYENLTQDLGPELMSIQETTRELRDSVESVRSIPRNMVDSVVKVAELEDTVEDLKGVEASLKDAGKSVSLAGDLVKKPIDEAVETARASLQPPKAGGEKSEEPAPAPEQEPGGAEAIAGEAAAQEAVVEEVAAQKETEPIDVGALSQAVAAAMTRLSTGQEGGEAPEIEAPEIEAPEIEESVEEKNDE
jgi:sec-independent protein translocase protein TatB